MPDETYMELALQLAEKTLGQTSPNPVVGAVVVKDGKVVGLGAHLQPGDAHAEVIALEMASEKAKDATLYVTLEPCSHYGKTPPCVEKIITNGLKRVVIATLDPHEKVNGQGVKRLIEAGIDVKVGVLEEKAVLLNQFFFHYIKTNLPYITLKAAMSLDGKIATKTGESKWITNQEAREDVHHLRKTHDAILVGINTVLEDNPSLTARFPDTGKHPIRIILDTHLRTPIDSTVVTDNQVETWIFVGKEVRREQMVNFADFQQVTIIQLPSEKIDIKEILHQLGEREITSLFVEGGAEIHGSFLKEGLFQQVMMYIAPKLIGGRNAPTVFGGEGIEKMADVFNLQFTEIEQLGKDLKIIAVKKEDTDVYGNC